MVPGGPVNAQRETAGCGLNMNPDFETLAEMPFVITVSSVAAKQVFSLHFKQSGARFSSRQSSQTTGGEMLIISTRSLLFCSIYLV